MKHPLNLNVKGHVNIVDKVSGEVLLDQCNAIHPQNMSRVIARALSHESNGLKVYLIGVAG